MDVLLADAENVLTYIDDVLVHSRSHEEHLKHLSAAIDKIGAANLRLNPRKCVFGSDSVEYLGHTLSGDGVRPGQDKAKAMQTAQPPRSVKELRSFCGLANYFRSYIVQFAIKAAPLFKLTLQESEWKGGDLPPEASKAFLQLREEIASQPVMAYPNHRRRDKDLVKTHGPRIKIVPNFLKNYGLSNESSLERIGRGLFVSRFYTKIVQKTEKYRFSKSSKNKKLAHSIIH
jgi:hypothetical protein